jgi:hypothetical protein
MSEENKVDGWIYTADRKPTNEDADIMRRVMACHYNYNTQKVVSWSYLDWERVASDPEHYWAWRRVPEAIPPRVKTKEQIEQEAIDLVDTIYNKDSTLVCRKDLIRLALGKGRELERAEWVKKIESKREHYESNTVNTLLDELLK